MSSGVLGVALLGTLLVLSASTASTGRTGGRHAVTGRVVTTAARPLPIPNPLTADWTAPAGRFTLPAPMVKVLGTATVDLSAATITGTTGYLFDVSTDGAHLTVVGGQLSGPFAGLVRDSLPDGSTAVVDISGTTLHGAQSVVYAPKAGGPISIRLDQVTATGLGDGIRATADAIDVTRSTLIGGGIPPSGYPAGVHSMDDSAGHVAVPSSTMNVSDSTIVGFTSAGFQGDSIIGETRVATAVVERNVLGHNSDTGAIDSKVAQAFVRDNIIYSDGDRAIASHYGTLTSSGNTIYQVAQSPDGMRGKAYQATGALTASDDQVFLSGRALLAQSSAAVTPQSGPRSTYPRVGQMTLTHITDGGGAVVLGPTTVSAVGSCRPTLVVYP